MLRRRIRDRRRTSQLAPTGSGARLRDDQGGDGPQRRRRFALPCRLAPRPRKEPALTILIRRM